MGDHRHPGRGGLISRRLTTVRRCLLAGSVFLSAACSASDPADLSGAEVSTTGSTTVPPPQTTTTGPPTPEPSTTVQATTSTSDTPTTGDPAPVPVLVASRAPAPGTMPLVLALDITPAERAVVDILVAQAIMRLPADSSTFAIARNGEPIATWSVGRTANGEPLTASSRFRVASVSKLIVSLAILRLADEGRIALDEPVLSQWTPPATPADPAFARITVRQLLQHTSGLDKHRGLFFDEGATDWHDAVRQIVALPLTSTPGREFRYTNADFVVLGELIEQLTGRAFEDAARELVLSPLGVTSAVMVGTHEQPDGDPWYPTGSGRNYMETTGPAGAWAMTAIEALALVREFDASTSTGFLRPETIAAARRGSGPIENEPDWQYGLGLMIFHGPIGHTGTLENALSADVTLPNDYSLMLSTTSEEPGDGEGLLAESGAALSALLRLPDTHP